MFTTLSWSELKLPPFNLFKKTFKKNNQLYAKPKFNRILPLASIITIVAWSCDLHICIRDEYFAMPVDASTCISSFFVTSFHNRYISSNDFQGQIPQLPILLLFLMTAPGLLQKFRQLFGNWCRISVGRCWYSYVIIYYGQEFKYSNPPVLIRSYRKVTLHKKDMISKYK